MSCLYTDYRMGGIMSSRSNLMVFLTVFMLSLSLNPAVSTELEEKSYEMGIAAGVLLPGDVYVSLHGGNVDRNANMMIRGFIDSYVVPKLALGAYVNFGTLNLKEDIDIGFWGQDEEYRIEKTGVTILELGGAIKHRFILSPNIAIKPALNIGYRRFFGETDFSTWNALGINGNCEFQYRIGSNLLAYFETGFLSQPSGGNVDTDITFDPTFYLLFGVAR